MMMSRSKYKNLFIFSALRRRNVLLIHDWRWQRQVCIMLKDVMQHREKKPDELYYTGNKPDIKKEVIIQEDEALGLLKHYHSSAIGGHSGINATLSKMSMYCTWNRMKQDVVEFVRRITLDKLMVVL